MNIDSINFEIQFIKDDKVKKLVIDTFNNKVPEYFWSYAASSTGKYHPLDRDGNPESLVNHTKAVTRVLISIINHPLLKVKFSDYEKDIMIAAALLHDSVKYGYPVPDKFTVHEHPLLVIKLYPYEDRSIDEYKIFIDICKLISTHSGPWITSKKSTVKLPVVNSESQWYVHLSDFIASRRFISVDNLDTEEYRKLLSPV